MAKNDTGVWLDTETGKVVTSKPSRGRQIVAPGKELTPNLERLVELYQDNADTRRTEQAVAPTNVETRVADADLSDKTKAELLELAAERDIEGRSSMTKAELLDALS